MLNDHDLAALLDGTGVSPSNSAQTDDAAIRLAFILLHGLLLTAVIDLFLSTISQ